MPLTAATLSSVSPLKSLNRSMSVSRAGSFPNASGNPFVQFRPARACDQTKEAASAKHQHQHLEGRHTLKKCNRTIRSFGPKVVKYLHKFGGFQGTCEQYQHALDAQPLLLLNKPSPMNRKQKLIAYIYTHILAAHTCLAEVNILQVTLLIAHKVPNVAQILVNV